MTFKGSTVFCMQILLKSNSVARKLMMRTLKQQQNLQNLTLVRVLVEANERTDSHVMRSSYGILHPAHNFIFKYFGN